MKVNWMSSSKGVIVATSWEEFSPRIIAPGGRSAHKNNPGYATATCATASFSHIRSGLNPLHRISKKKKQDLCERSYKVFVLFCFKPFCWEVLQQQGTTQINRQQRHTNRKVILPSTACNCMGNILFTIPAFGRADGNYFWQLIRVQTSHSV